MLLTAGGQAYSVGANQFGECGVGFCCKTVENPSPVRGIGGMLIVDVLISKGSTFTRRRSGTPEPSVGGVPSDDDNAKAYTFSGPAAMRELARKAMAKISATTEEAPAERSFTPHTRDPSRLSPRLSVHDTVGEVGVVARNTAFWTEISLLMDTFAMSRFRIHNAISYRTLDFYSLLNGYPR